MNEQHFATLDEFENGDLTTTETNYCRVSRQALVTALSTLATKEAVA
ncbi:hypothetical protein ACFRCX_10455 [Streptomyces sp. NPDC056652]